MLINDKKGINENVAGSRALDNNKDKMGFIELYYVEARRISMI